MSSPDREHNAFFRKWWVCSKSWPTHFQWQQVYPIWLLRSPAYSADKKFRLLTRQRPKRLGDMMAGQRNRRKTQAEMRLSVASPFFRWSHWRRNDVKTSRNSLQHKKRPRSNVSEGDISCPCKRNGRRKSGDNSKINRDYIIWSCPHFYPKPPRAHNP